MMIPALPKRSPVPKSSEMHLEKLKPLLNRFLTAICKSEILKSCKLVVSFLKQENQSSWLALRTQFEKLKFDRKLSSVVYGDG